MKLVPGLNLECVGEARWHAKDKFFTMPLKSKGVTQAYSLWGTTWIGIKINGIRGPVRDGLFGIGKEGSEIPPTWKYLGRKKE